MGLRNRTKRLEKCAGAHTAELVCQECGETIKVPADIALRINLAAWHQMRGEEYDDPAVSLVERHPHDALVNVRTGRPPGLPRGW